MMVMRHIKVRTADVRRVWGDTTIRLPEAAFSLGMSVDCLQDRAKALGLPQRSTGRREAIRPHMEKEFRVMWRAGVSARLIGAHFGCSYIAVRNAALRLGLAMRGYGYRPRMTLDGYVQARLGVAMKVQATSEAAVRRAANDADEAWLKAASGA